MANWDHRSNIGTHPILSRDPRVRLTEAVAVATRERDKFQALLDQYTAELAALDTEDHWNAFMDDPTRG